MSAKIIEQSSDLFLDFSLVPVVSAAIAVAVYEVPAHFVFIAE